jgi:hypothetical protein
MSEGVRTLELVAAASEACDEAVFRQLLQQTVFNKETLDELAEGLIFEAVSTCQSLAAADRIQIMLVHSIVAESAACSLSSGLSSGTNDGFALPSQISVTLCEALSNLLLSYNDILKVFWKEFQDAMASMQFPAAALSRNKLIFYAFLEVARLPEKYDDVHQEISLAAILYAHQVYTFESESFEDTTFEEIIRIYILSFNGEEIDSSLLSLSLPLVKNLTRVQFDAYFVPVLNDTLESLTVGSHVLEFMQTCTVFITLLTSCGKEDFLDGYMEDHGIVDILVDTCMELLIEKTSNEVVPSVSRLLSGIIQALPQRGFVLVSDALFQALNIDGEVFGDVLECRAFLKRASQCLEKVAQEGVDFKNYQREHLIDSYDQDWRDISYQMIQILKVMGDYLNSLALPAWENVYILSGGEQVLPLSDDTDTEEIRSDQISEVSEQTRSELSQDEKSTESDADSVFSSNTSLGHEISCKPLHTSNEHAAASDVKSSTSLDQEIASKLSKASNSNEHVTAAGEGTRSSTSLDQKIASKLSKVSNEHETTFDQDKSSRALDQKMASKLSKVSSEHTIFVDQDTSSTSLDRKIASKLTAARNPFEHAASSEVTSSSALDQKIASKLSKVSNEHTTIVDQDTSISSLDQTIASKVTTAHNPLQHAASSEVTSSSALDQKIASKLSKASNEHTTILDQDTSSSALDQTIASKCSPATRNPLEHAAYSTSERDLDKEVQVGNRTSVNSSSTLSDMCYSVDSMRNSRLSMSASGSSLGNLSGAHSSSERMKDRQRYSKNASLIGTNYVCDHYISDSEESTSNEDDKHAHQNVKNYDNPRHLGNKVGSKLSVLKEDKYHPSKASSRLFTASGGSGFSHGRRRNMQGFIGSSSETVDLASDIFENEEEERRIGTSSGSSMQVAAESGREAERMPLVEDQFTYDGAVVVAMAIEDGEAQEVDEAVQYDPSTKLRLNKKIQKWTLISFLAATAVTIILIVLLSKRQLEILEVDGTEAPSLAPTTASYQEIALILRDEFGPDHSYNDEDTAYGKAFDWITRDEFVLDAIENNNNGFKVDREVSIDRIHQRFLFGLFYYEMRGDSWVNCSESLAIQGGTCSYINREGEIIDGNSNWLSPLDVCAWAGINCDNSDRVIILDLSK